MTTDEISLSSLTTHSQEETNDTLCSPSTFHPSIVPSPSKRRKLNSNGYYVYPYASQTKDITLNGIWMDIEETDVLVLCEMKDNIITGYYDSPDECPVYGRIHDNQFTYRQYFSGGGLIDSVGVIRTEQSSFPYIEIKWNLVGTNENGIIQFIWKGPLTDEIMQDIERIHADFPINCTRHNMLLNLNAHHEDDRINNNEKKTHADLLTRDQVGHHNGNNHRAHVYEETNIPILWNRKINDHEETTRKLKDIGNTTVYVSTPLLMPNDQTYDSLLHSATSIFPVLQSYNNNNNNNNNGNTNNNTTNNNNNNCSIVTHNYPCLTQIASVGSDGLNHRNDGNLFVHERRKNIPSVLEEPSTLHPEYITILQEHNPKIISNQNFNDEIKVNLSKYRNEATKQCEEEKGSSSPYTTRMTTSELLKEKENGIIETNIVKTSNSILISPQHIIDLRTDEENLNINGKTSITEAIDEKTLKIKIKIKKDKDKDKDRDQTQKREEEKIFEGVVKIFRSYKKDFINSDLYKATVRRCGKRIIAKYREKLQGCKREHAITAQIFLDKHQEYITKFVTKYVTRLSNIEKKEHETIKNE